MTINDCHVIRANPVVNKVAFVVTGEDDTSFPPIPPITLSVVKEPKLLNTIFIKK